MDEASETIGPYKILSTIGHGAGSTIYQVRHADSGGVFALKHVQVQESDQKKFLQQLEAELACSNAVDHPSIRRCFELKKVRTLLRVTEAYLVMELVRGVNLAQVQPKTMTGKIQAFYGAAEGLAALQEAGLVHADIKPNNILIDTMGKVRLIDLGQSCPAGTIKERIQGTPDYIAPEQVKRRALTAQTDMFNLGATMYWCVTGRTVPTLIPELDADGNPLPHKNDGFPRPIKVNPEVPPLLDKLIGDCLRTNPAKRPESWQLILNRLKIIFVQLKQAKLQAATIQVDATPEHDKTHVG